MNRKTALLLAAAAAIIIILLTFCSSCKSEDEIKKEHLAYAKSQGYVKLPDGFAESDASCYFKESWSAWDKFCSSQNWMKKADHTKATCREEFPCLECPECKKCKKAPSTETGGPVYPGGSPPEQWNHQYPPASSDAHVPVP